MKRALLLTGMLLLVAFSSGWAQQKEVGGKVVDADGNPIPAATIVISGTTTGTTANGDGQFKLNAKAGDQLEVSSIGYQKKMITVPEANSPLTITLSSNSKVLNEMVVTALGISRKKRSLGSAIQEVSGSDLAALKEPNLTNTLKGKVAGLQIVGGGSGITSSSKIILRGYNSLTGSNQPLIVVDGVPYDNFTGMSNNDFWNPSLDMGNGLSDLDAANIKSVTVLKGASAAALYGSRAGNGVILITTKSGLKQKGLGISISSSIGFQKVFAYPDMQNDYGRGNLGNLDPLFKYEGSWGPKATGQMVTNWNGKKVPYRIYNNVENFYQTGITSNQHIAFQQKYGSTSIYTSYSRMDDKGINPGVDLARNNIMAKAITNFGPDKRWTVNTKIQVINSKAQNRPQTGFARADISSYTIYNFPRSIDITDFSAATDAAGDMLWYNTSGNNYNPYWDAKYDLNTDIRNRYLMHGIIQYKFTNWLKAKIEGGADMYTSNNESKTYAGSPANNSFGVGKKTYSETNYSTLITAQKDHLFGKWGGSFSLGGNLMNRKFSSINGSAGDLVVPDLFTLGNSAGNPSITYGNTHKKINSVYGMLDINYDDFLYLTATLRNDWSSALSKANRSFMYPSVSLSYIFTAMLDNLPNWLTYGKLRGSFASVGNDLAPYKLYNTFYIGKDPNGNTTAWRNSTLYNPDVRSELIKSYEVGLNMRFIQSRVGFDLTFYKSNSTRQLISIPMDPLSGYSGMLVNAGNIQNKGVELMIDAQILKNPNGLNWDLSANFSSNNNTIKALYGDVTSYSLGGFDAIAVKAVVGKKYGAIYGTTYERVTDPKSPYYGQKLLNEEGLPQQATGAVYLGNQQPDALLGFTTNFRYKNFGLSASVDGSFGGKMFSATLAAMEANGTAGMTVVNHRRDSFVVRGVIESFDADGNSTGYFKNTKSVSPQKYWEAVAGVGNTGITEANLYDATNVRLRNIQLSYNFSRSMLARTPFQKASITLSCNNVFMISSHMHGLDPESSYATGTNAVGFESGSSPTLRTFYISINLGF